MKRIWQSLEDFRERLLIIIFCGLAIGGWVAIMNLLWLYAGRWAGLSMLIAFAFLLWIGPSIWTAISYALEFDYWWSVRAYRRWQQDRRSTVRQRIAKEALKKMEGDALPRSSVAEKAYKANLESERTKMAAEALQRRADWEKKQSGQGVVEYALILVLVAVVVIVILAVISPSFNASPMPIEGLVTKTYTGVINGYSYGYAIVLQTLPDGSTQVQSVTLPINAFGLINEGDHCRFSLSSRLNNISGLPNYMDQLNCTPNKDR